MDDKPTYTRNQIVNKQEEVQTILMAAPHTTPEYITRKLLTVLGDADMVEEILKELAAEDLKKFKSGGENPQLEEPPNEE